jgi:hypothetical protein
MPKFMFGPTTVPANSSPPPPPGGQEAGATSIFNQTPQGETVPGIPSSGVNPYQRPGSYDPLDNPSASAMSSSTFTPSWVRAQSERTLEGLNKRAEKALNILLAALHTGVFTSYWAYVIVGGIVIQIPRVMVDAMLNNKWLLIFCAWEYSNKMYPKPTFDLYEMWDTMEVSRHKDRQK